MSLIKQFVTWESCGNNTGSPNSFLNSENYNLLLIIKITRSIDKLSCLSIPICLGPFRECSYVSLKITRWQYDTSIDNALDLHADLHNLYCSLGMGNFKKDKTRQRTFNIFANKFISYNCIGNTSVFLLPSALLFSPSIASQEMLTTGTTSTVSV